MELLIALTVTMTIAAPGEIVIGRVKDLPEYVLVTMTVSPDLLRRLRRPMPGKLEWVPAARWLLEE